MIDFLVTPSRPYQPVDGRLVSYLLKTPLNDGGQWDMLVNLVLKFVRVCVRGFVRLCAQGTFALSLRWIHTRRFAKHSARKTTAHHRLFSHDSTRAHLLTDTHARSRARMRARTAGAAGTGWCPSLCSRTPTPVRALLVPQGGRGRAGGGGLRGGG